MNLLFPAAAAAALIAAAAAFADEDSYRRDKAEPGCAAVLDGAGPDGSGAITGLVATDRLFLTFSAWSESWPARQDEPYGLDIGLDGAPPRHRVEGGGSHRDGTLAFEIEPDLRALLRGARSIEFYRDGRRVGSASADALGAALDTIEACAAADPVLPPDPSRAKDAAAEAERILEEAAGIVADDQPD